MLVNGAIGALLGGIAGLAGTAAVSAPESAVESASSGFAQTPPNTPSGSGDNLVGLKSFVDAQNAFSELLHMAKGGGAVDATGKSPTPGNPALANIYRAMVNASKVGNIVKRINESDEAPSALTVVVARREWELGLGNLRDGVNKLYENPTNPSFSPGRCTTLRSEIEKELEETLSFIHTKSLASTRSV